MYIVVRADATTGGVGGRWVNVCVRFDMFGYTCILDCIEGNDPPLFIKFNKWIYTRERKKQ